MKSKINNQQWFELQLNTQEAFKKYKIRLPDLPPDEVQIRFSGRSGKLNLQQAFSFYKYVYSTCNLDQINEPRILDFGGGWGRIVRFFLKDTKPEFIWITDCLSDAIYWLQTTKNPCNILKNRPLPPITGLESHFNLIYAFSVFSHLSEDYFNTWVTYLMNLILPGGYLVFTTRGQEFIDTVDRFQRGNYQWHGKDFLPNAVVLRKRYLKGEFQFYPTGGGGELTSDFYGEAFIPRVYIEHRYKMSLVDFNEKVPYVDQSVIVLRRKKEG